MATQYRLSFGPWNIHEGADPFGPPVRPTREFVDKLDIAVRLGFQGIQFHDDDVIPADLPASQMERAVAEVKKLLRIRTTALPALATTESPASAAA